MSPKRCGILKVKNILSIEKYSVSVRLNYQMSIFVLCSFQQDEESIPIMYRNLPEYKELLQFKKLKKQKLQQMQAESGFVQHVGFKVSSTSCIYLFNL